MGDISDLVDHRARSAFRDCWAHFIREDYRQCESFAEAEGAPRSVAKVNLPLSYAPKTIGIVGCRVRNSHADYLAVEQAFLKLYRKGDHIVSGGCPRGGDRFADMIARRHGVGITVHRPDWGRYGRSAGFRRNGLIAADADVLIACVAPDRKGGTEDTISKFLKRPDHGELVLV